jgi:hypothetical protein
MWEHLRGYDKWIETEARIESSDVEETEQVGRYGNVVGYAYSSGDKLTWTDRQGEKQFADFTVSDDSPLYQLIGGETVSIRYDPARPDRFYYRELMRTRVNTAVKSTLVALLFLVALTGIIFLRISFHDRLRR